MSQNTLPKSLVKQAPVHYYPDFLTLQEANTLLNELKETTFERHTHQGRKLARNTAVYGDNLEKIPPKIWGDDVKIEAWSPVMKKTLEKVKQFLELEFNVCLVNHYETGKNYIGWHADNEEKGDTYCIASISLGATRKFSFLLKSKELDCPSEKEQIDLEHGSLLVMKHPCQDLYLHSLPPDKKVKEERINLTYRIFHYEEEEKPNLQK